VSSRLLLSCGKPAETLASALVVLTETASRRRATLRLGTDLLSLEPLLGTVR
jgi:hypothetical protein